MSLLLCGQRGLRGELFSRDHPAPAHRLVEVHQRLVDHRLGLGARELRVEERALGVDDLEVARVALVEPQPRDARVLEQGIDLPALGGELLPRPLLVDERVVDLPERVLDGLLVVSSRQPSA